MLDFFDFTRTEVAAHLCERQFAAVHVRDLFRLAYKKAAKLSKTLPPRLGTHMNATFAYPELSIHMQQESEADKTVKFLFGLHDGREIETVLIPEKGRL